MKRIKKEWRGVSCATVSIQGDILMNRMTEQCCCSCQNAKPFSNFHTHVIIGKKYLPVCKACCSKKLKEYIVATKSEAAGLWCLLAELGIPFLREVWEPTQKIVFESTNAGRKPDLFLTYLRVLKELGNIVEGFWQSDMMLDDFIESKKGKKEESKELIDWNEQVAIWGKFVQPDGTMDRDAYDYLNFTFADYTKDLLEMDANLIRRYRDLAKAELRKRKADESGDIQEIAKAQDNLRKMLEMLKLNEFQSNQLSEEKRSYEYNVALVENYRPSECEELQEYLDKVGYEKEKAILMRSIRNSVAGTRDYPDIPKEYQ